MAFKLFSQINKSEKGISLAEILVVVAIISILSAVSVASIQIANQRERVRAAARDLVSLLREAQTQTLQGQYQGTSAAPTFVYVQVDPAADEYILFSSQKDDYQQIIASSTGDQELQRISYHPQVLINEKDVSTGEYTGKIIIKSPFGEVVGEFVNDPLILIFEGAAGRKWEVEINQGFGKFDVRPAD